MKILCKNCPCHGYILNIGFFVLILRIIISIIITFIATFVRLPLNSHGLGVLALLGNLNALRSPLIFVTQMRVKFRILKYLIPEFVNLAIIKILFEPDTIFMMGLNLSLINCFA
jgi:hypothetical protein